MKTMAGSEIQILIEKLDTAIRTGADSVMDLSLGGDLNKIRIRIKNEIVEETGSGFKDIKINHASS